MKKSILKTAMIFVVIGALLMSCRSTKKAFAGEKVEQPQTITFQSLDGIPISADLYLAYDKSAPLILLCHRAKWSRGEYLEIAPKLNLLGFNAVAIDQRSGETKNEVLNETKIAAETARLSTNYLDAEQDIQAAVDYVSKNYAKGKIILWGSSYSSSLGFVIAAKNEKKLSGYLAFSPGEYFSDQGKSANWIETEAKKVKIPVFVTCQNKEGADVQKIFDAVSSKDKTFYLPEYASKHGSQALYEATENNEKTWENVKTFLSKFN